MSKPEEEKTTHVLQSMNNASPLLRRSPRQHSIPSPTVHPPTKRKLLVGFNNKKDSTNNDDDTDTEKKLRGKSFSPEEDVILCKAYAIVTVNPIKGSDQPLGMFWGSIAKKYNAMITKEEYTSMIIYEERPANSLMLRFSKRISKDVALWLTYYNSAKKTYHSGWKDND